jgi:hypothetical protein
MQWIKQIRRDNWEPTSYTCICSEHFEKTCYIEAEGKINRLNKNAVPTIFPKFPSYLQVKKSAPRRPLNRLDNNQDQPTEKKIKMEASPVCTLEVVKKDHNYVLPSPPKLKLWLDQEKAKNEELQKKLQNRDKTIRRLETTASNLIDIVVHLKKRHLLQENAFDVLKKAASDVPSEIFNRFQKNLNTNSITKEAFPETLKKFAMTLHFHSPKAYRYVTYLNLF